MLRRTAWRAYGPGRKGRGKTLVSRMEFADLSAPADRGAGRGHLRARRQAARCAGGAAARPRRRRRCRGAADRRAVGRRAAGHGGQVVAGPRVAAAAAAGGGPADRDAADRLRGRARAGSARRRARRAPAQRRAAPARGGRPRRRRRERCARRSSCFAARRWPTSSSGPLAGRGCPPGGRAAGGARGPVEPISRSGARGGDPRARGARRRAPLPRAAARAADARALPRRTAGRCARGLPARAHGAGRGARDRAGPELQRLETGVLNQDAALELARRRAPGRARRACPRRRRGSSDATPSSTPAPRCCASTGS